MKDTSEIKHAGDESSQTECAALERVVWRKLDRWTLPLCTIFYLLAFLDRTNIGNARVAGMQKSLAMTNYQYAIALTVTSAYVNFEPKTYMRDNTRSTSSYIASELPFTLLLKYVGADLMLPAMVTVWGIVCALQGLVHNYSGLLACRFFLGFAEGGLFPGIVLYLSSFYPRQRLQIRIATFYVSTSLSGAFSGLLAAAIDNMNGIGGKPGWAWIYILEGIFSFLFGLISFSLLPRSPETAHFLTEKERAYVISTLKQAGSMSEEAKNDNFSWTEVMRAAKSPHLWILSSVCFFSGALVFGMAYFEPTIVASLGYSGNRAQLMSVPPFAVTFVLSLISSILSDRYQHRGFTVILFSLLALIGFSMFYAIKSSHVRYGSLFFTIPGIYCTAPALITWISNNSAPHVRRATAVGMKFVVFNSGGILSIWLLGSMSPAPNYAKATITFIIMSALMAVFSTATLAYLWRENRLKAERRERMEKEEEAEGLGDRSAWFIYSL